LWLLQTFTLILTDPIMKNTTRNTLLLTAATVALMASFGLSSAQDTKDNRESPGAAHDRMAPAGKMDQHPDSVRQKSAAPTAQAPKKEKPTVTVVTPAGTESETAGRGSVAHTQEPPNARIAPGAARDETKSDAPAALSIEQHAKLWQTMRGEKTERLTNVQFSTTVGGVIPGTVHLYNLPVSIVEYAPQYRDYEYILVGDEILIVDPRTLRIVAVIAA
jgi:Protein of unknown function (DUF1236)